MEIEIKGMETLFKGLDNLEPSLKKKALSKALREGAKVVQTKARQLAPEGNIRNSIKVRAMRHEGKGARESRANNVGVQVEIDLRGRPPWYYAGMVEKGHRIVVGGSLKKGGKAIGYVEGKYYMLDAKEQVGDQAKEVSTNKLKEEIDLLNRKV